MIGYCYRGHRAYREHTKLRHLPGTKEPFGTTLYREHTGTIPGHTGNMKSQPSDVSTFEASRQFKSRLL